MAGKRSKTGSTERSRVPVNIVYWTIVLILLALLFVMYIHNRNRKADYMKLQFEAAGSEKLYELTQGAGEE